MYSSTPSVTLALNGGGSLAPRPGRFTPGKESRYPLYRRLSRPQDRSVVVVVVAVVIYKLYSSICQC
jgi:hypothetical protein